MYSQEKEYSFELFTKSYSKEFNAMPQIFDIAQDYRGIMYFANGDGFIEYDGLEWRKISLFPEIEINSIEADTNGIIFAGGVNDFGYLGSSDSGKIEFSSLKRLLPDSIDFKRIQHVKILSNNKVFFQSKKYIFVYDGEILNIIKCIPETDFRESFDFKDNYYVSYRDENYASSRTYGLLKYENGNLIASEFGEKYRDFEIFGLLDFNDKDIVVTDQHGIYENKNSDSLFLIDSSFLTHTFYRSLSVNNLFLSLGTFGDGVYLYDDNFKLTYKVNQSSGLLDGVIQCQYVDKDGNLWIGTNNGISKVLINSPVSLYNLKDHKISTVESIIGFNDFLFIATFNGVYFADLKSIQNGLKKINDISVDCYGFMLFNSPENNQYLLVAGVDAVYCIDENFNVDKIALKCGPYSLKLQYGNPNKIIVCNYNGLSSIDWDGSKFIDNGYVKNFNEDIYNFEFDDVGGLYLGSKKNGLFKTSYDVFYDENIHIENISNEVGIEEGHAILNKINNNIYVGTDKGLFENKSNKWIKSNIFDSDKYQDYGVHRIQKAENGDVWMVLYEPENNYNIEVGYAKKNKTDDKYTWYSDDFKNYTSEIIHSIYTNDSNFVWLGGIEHIFRYDRVHVLEKNHKFNTLLRSVKLGDLILFNGAYKSVQDSLAVLDANVQPITLEFSNNRIEFKFAATSFFNESKTEFSYILDGQDLIWSNWSNVSSADYTNLLEGSYVFKVKSRNYLHEQGKMTSFSFTILPPWYKTVWAYFLYVIAAILLLVLGIRVGTNRIKRQKDLLEKVVKKRTQEVTDQKNEIEGQREELQELYNDVTDSIRYAKRLQDSILPSDNFIKELFPESFVYFKPKDIVSGDFYWAEKIGENHLIAAVDCTGHGVPGAFMSLVGANGLNASVREHQLNETNIILEDLNRFAFSSLNKADEGESVRDGMDMSLISFNPKTREMTFSGANNPLYVVSNGEFKIIKGDKFAIGSFKPGKEEFTQHSVELKTNDMVYLFSDGYPDQFGGQKGKKLMYKQFRNILLDISTLPLEKQKQELHDRLQKWKSDQEQVDDILVIGFRVN